MEFQNYSKTRCIGIDVENHSYEMAIMGKQGKSYIYRGKMNAVGRQVLYRKLRAADKVAMKTGKQTFIMAKEIEASVGCQVYLVNPTCLPLVDIPMDEDGKKDSLKLACIFNG